MQTCPKCGFQGRSAEQCEKCGVIFDRMHTVIDLRPLGAGAKIAPNPVRRPPLDPHEAPTVVLQRPHLPGRAPAAIAQAFPSPERSPATRGVDLEATAREVPLVPRVAPRQERSLARRLGPLLVVLALVAGGWAAVTLRSRHLAAQAQEPAPAHVDAAYFDIALDALLAECRGEFRRVLDPVHAEEARAHIDARLAYLHELLSSAALPPATEAAYRAAIEALQRFLATDVPPALAAARELGGRAEPTSAAGLHRAAAALDAARGLRPAP
jgi:hypothetical protein